MPFLRVAGIDEVPCSHSIGRIYFVSHDGNEMSTSEVFQIAMLSYMLSFVARRIEEMVHSLVVARKVPIFSHNVRMGRPLLSYGTVPTVIVL